MEIIFYIIVSGQVVRSTQNTLDKLSVQETISSCFNYTKHVILAVIRHEDVVDFHYQYLTVLMECEQNI